MFIAQAMNAEGAEGRELTGQHTSVPMSVPPIQNLHTLILAAGRGTRMGGPKALLTFANEPWWRIQSRRLTSTGIPTAWVISDAVRAAIAPNGDGPQRLITADSGAPMFTSILTGLRALAPNPPQAVFILPVDAPVPEPSVWRTLAESVNDQDAPVSIPTFQGKTGHPVLLRWSWIESTLFAAAPAADPTALRLDTLIAPVARRIPVTDPCVVINLNTPDDVSAYLASGH